MAMFLHSAQLVSSLSRWLSHAWLRSLSFALTLPLAAHFSVGIHSFIARLARSPLLSLPLCRSPCCSCRSPSFPPPSPLQHFGDACSRLLATRRRRRRLPTENDAAAFWPRLFWLFGSWALWRVGRMDVFQVFRLCSVIVLWLQRQQQSDGRRAPLLRNDVTTQQRYVER